MNQIYFQIVKEIEELSHTIEQIRMEIETYLKMGNVFGGPSGMKGVDYSTEKVRGSSKMSFSDAMRKIGERENVLQPYLEKLAALKKLKETFDELHESNRDTIDAKVFYLRFVKNYTQRETACELGYSERQIQRIEKRLRDREKSTKK